MGLKFNIRPGANVIGLDRTKILLGRMWPDISKSPSRTIQNEHKLGLFDYGGIKELIEIDFLFQLVKNKIELN